MGKKLDKFLSIRPYKDEEVASVLTALTDDSKVLDALIALQFPTFISSIPFVKFFVQRKLKSKTKNIYSIDDYQNIFKVLMEEMIKKTIASFSAQGLEQLDPNESYLFISNHRDIALDAALLNLSLAKLGHKTFNFAVGDNLMEESWASDLMRLNKSFIIKRSGETKKEIYEALVLASEFIQKSIFDVNESIWIAQKQGRAKNGIDVTDPAMLKMIHLTARKKQTAADYFNSLKVVPVGISYELDPNDLNKALELDTLLNHTKRHKKPNEDLDSIALGIQGQKGAVAINLSEPLKFEADDSYDEIASKITKSILSLYQLHATNYAAGEMLGVVSDHPCPFNDTEIQLGRVLLEKRVLGLESGVKEQLLQQYLNPLLEISKL